MIVGGKVQRFELKLREPLETSAGRITTRAGVLLTLWDAQGRCGFGDAAPIPFMRGFAGETVEVCERALAETVSELAGRSPDEAAAQLPAGVHLSAAAQFALETALVDLAARGQGIRAADWLAGGPAPHARVPVNALVTGRAPEAVRRCAARARDAGFQTFKLKIGPSGLAGDARRVEALRRAAGPEARIRLDANGAWSVEEADAALRELARFEVEYVEDPIRVHTPGDVDALASLKATSPVPLAADDCTSSAELVERVLEQRAADVLILKPATLGGLVATRQLAHEARSASLDVVVTSTIDSAVGLSAALHLAASLPGPLAACGLATADLLAEDLATPPAIEGGWMPLPMQPGLGLDLAGQPQ